MRLSVLDLAPVDPDVPHEEALHATVSVAQAAEQHGYERVWYAEHHNMPVIASSATAVLIAHVAANTERIRLGAGGIMLPNHSPLVIAEQFGTLAALHPDRIDLGLGRAPGTDGRTVLALRRDPQASDSFPRDVVELQRFLAGMQPVAGVRAVPVAQTPPPLFILGSSLFGASLAAQLGVPYAFASHFAPDAMHQALAEYRNSFKPSEQLTDPYAIVGANVTAAATNDDAARVHREVLRRRVRSFLLRGRPEAESIGDDELDVLIESPQGRQIANMMRVSAVGDGDAVRAGLDRLQTETDADEIMLAFHGRNTEERLTSLRVTADAVPH
ncbi:LLM class flavin-dependent oxidoreductase [uncultured Agrococcus sp.]|uniref:LLM class flavin-dependent oxidoreductase n=1 Tax=uncultured Agrococcus sp. TaxID=382258 RepID=UPI0025D73CF8|nr:LLM class flavin-dependent oxidoreductase [uncultured Agrococcus sp.]